MSARALDVVEPLLIFTIAISPVIFARHCFAGLQVYDSLR